MPRFTPPSISRSPAAPDWKLLRLTLLTAAVVVFPHAVSAQDNGTGTINFAMPTGAAAAQNPYDVAPEGAVAAEAAVENVQKHWTQMNYGELKAELARQDTNYSVKLRAEMEARLKTLEDAALGATAEGTAGELPPVTPTQVAPAATSTGQPAAPAVVVVPPADTTPWWKKPKSERAAAKEAARARDAAAGGDAEKPRELTPREQIYQQIQNNRGR